MTERIVLFHIDMDSPQTLLQFWGRPEVQPDMERFYAAAMDRVLDFFSSLQIPATFFCIGQEIENSQAGRRYLRKAFESKHEIANHTYTHPIGLTRLPDDVIRTEVENCSRVIQEITGERPAGFRAPSYEINNQILNILEENNFLYDSSAFWTSLNPLMKIYHRLFSARTHAKRSFGEAAARIPRDPYYPSSADWMKQGEPRGIFEIPLPRTKIFHLPFYSNFHLSMTGFMRSCTVDFMQQPCVVYLFHLIEFVDFSDGIPAELKIHPNLKTPAIKKIHILRNIVQKLQKKYQPLKTLDYINGLRKAVLQSSN